MTRDVTRRAALGGAVGLGAAACATAPVASPEIAAAARFDVDGGWHEAVGVVGDLDAAARFWTDVAGWRLGPEMATPADRMAFWGLPGRGARERIAVAPDYPQGWVRLVQIDGPRAPVARSNAQAWDTGGVFSVMTRSSDLDRNLADGDRLGWTAFNDPYPLDFGGVALRNAVLRSPDGCHVAIYERQTWDGPAPAAGTLTKAFNSMQMVADRAASAAFYKNALAFAPIVEGTFIDPDDRPTNFAMPVNFATRVPRHFSILRRAQADPEAGRVELMQFEGLVGRRLDARARFPNRGWMSLWFPVRSLEATLQDLPLAAEPTWVDWAPYGRVRAAMAAAPEGALLTFFEAPG